MRLFLISILLFVFQIASQSIGENYFLNEKTSLRGRAFEKNQDIIAKLYPTDEVELLLLEENLAATKKEDEFWAKVKFENKEGYVLFKYLQKEKPILTKPIIRERFIPIKYFTTASSLYMRESPYREGEIITSLSQNSELTVNKFSENDDLIDGISAKWAFVRASSGVEGWVFAGYISESKKDIAEEEDQNHILFGTTKYVRTKYLQLRNEPSKYGTIVYIAANGSVLKVLDRRKEFESIGRLRSIWVKVEQDGTSGWVFGGFLSDKKTSTVIADTLDKTFLYPLDSGVGLNYVSSSYGTRIDPVTKKPGSNHTGVDLYAYTGTGTPIYAAGDGTVIHTSSNSGYGNLTVVKHDSGLVTYYAHQNEWLVKQGDRVRAGDLIGKIGNTGKSTGPHLHFEVRTGLWEECLNPANYISLPANN